MALAQGRFRQAQAVFEEIVSTDRLLFDWSLGVWSAGATIRDGLVRTYLALGEKQKAAKALEGLLDRDLERLNHPVLNVRALYDLGVLKIESGDQTSGRELLEDFLDHWGNSDWDLPEVEDAKTRLATLQSS